jgi:hypothetical protein
MNEAIKFLNQNSGALTVIFTAVVTLSTVVYAILTALLVVETKRMREVQTEPKIAITLKPFDFAIHIIRLHIKNIGLGPAENVTFTPSVITGGEAAQALLKEFTETNFFTTGLRYFGPGEEKYSHYTQISQNYEQKIASSLMLEVKYESATGKKYKEKITIDMSEIKGGYQLGTPNLQSMAKSLETIQKDISHLASGFKKLKTDVYTSEDREKERAERERWIRDQEEKQKNS